MIIFLGDGTRDEPLVIRGDKLDMLDDLLAEAEREMNNELKPVVTPSPILIDASITKAAL